jgi:hypothetical protein
MNQETITKLLGKSEAELLQEIGRELIGKPAAPLSNEELEAEGRGWLRARWDVLAEAICSNNIVQTIMNMPKSLEQDVQLVAAIADLISGLSMGVSPWTLSALLVKSGVEKLCAKRS